MSCYHPLIGIDTGERTESGKVKYWIRCRKDSADFQLEIDNNEHIKIPCGHCIGCRLDYSRSWADRMMLELETAGVGLFVTLTYNNDHVPVASYSDDGFPETYTLDKRDVQLFMKRLRKAFDGRDGRPFRKIRFFAAGEYGEHTLRPHYHIILFGIGLRDFPDIVLHGRNELGQNYYISDSFSVIWTNGFSLLADVSWKTCAYVARYVTKKYFGAWSIDYVIRNCIPEFSLMSRKPGIGKEYLDLHPDCLDFNNINLSTAEGGLQIRIPKYYLNQLKFVPKKYDKKKNCYVEVPEENPLLDVEKYDKIMSDRKRFAEDAMLIKLQKTGLSYLDYLEAQEERKMDCVKVLKRGAVL